MNYWIAKANPKLNNPFDTWIISRKIGQWWTKCPPRTWSLHDRIFIWASSPDSKLVALSELVTLQDKADTDGYYYYSMRYLTGLLDHPITRATLSGDLIIKQSSLFKQGIMRSVLPLTPEEGQRLYQIVVTHNPAISAIWSDIAKDSSLSNQDDIELTVSAPEGARILRIHYSVERNPGLVRAKKESVLLSTGKLACSVCTFDFVERYGEIGQDFCEVHHTKGLAEYGIRDTTLSNLEIVCSNCHRMLHRTVPFLSTDELRVRIQRIHKQRC